MMRTIRRTRLSLKLVLERRRRQTLVWLVPEPPGLHESEMVPIPKGVRYIETRISRAPAARVCFAGVLLRVDGSEP